jgi:hypothetical protein
LIPTFDSNSKSLASKFSPGITSNFQTWIQPSVTIPIPSNQNHLLESHLTLKPGSNPWLLFPHLGIAITENHLLEFILTFKPCSNFRFPL